MGELESDEIFTRPIVGNENSPVSDLISELQNSDWVRQGIENYVTEPADQEKSVCPFCQEETVTSALVQSIRGFFDETYTTAIKQISTIETQYRAQVGLLPSIGVYESHPLATEHLPELRLRLQALVTLTDQNLQAIKVKAGAPSSPVALSATREAVQTINAEISKINDQVKKHNDRIVNRNRERARLKSEFWSIMRWEYDPAISAWQGATAKSKERLEAETAALKQLNDSVLAKRQSISNLQKKTVNIDGAIANINTALVQLGISDFSIARHCDVHYRIIRLGESEALFTSLSEGEKMIISFLYFCEVCKGKQSAHETTQRKIAVIDDPISSLSHIFVFNIGQLLKRDFFASGIFDQVFVLTHSLYFFYELADINHERRSENQKLFRLTKSIDGSRITEMKYEEIQNDYQSYWAIVLDSDQHPALIANCMRNIVEYFFGFVEKSALNNVFQKPKLQEDRYQAFYRYMNRESHSSGQNLFDFKEFDYEVFREGLKLLFDEAGYPEHYQKMLKSIPH